MVNIREKLCFYPYAETAAGYMSLKATAFKCSCCEKRILSKNMAKELTAANTKVEI